MWYTTEKRKTKINHTSKAGLHQLEKRRNGLFLDLLLESPTVGSARPLANWLLIYVIFIVEDGETVQLVALSSFLS
jgi:hypothetical protein